MKLITELNEDIQSSVITEESTGIKSMYLEGVFLQSGIKNRNNRIYPPPLLEREVNRYQKEAIDRKVSFGELQHPASPALNLKEVCIRITKLERNGNDYIGKALVLPTPNGKIVESIIQTGGYLGVSSRGMGSLKKQDGVDIVQDDYFLAVGADVVANPSAPSAWVNGVMESVSWKINELGEWVMEAQDQVRKQVHSMSTAELTSKQTAMFESFLRRIDESRVAEHLAKKSNVALADVETALKRVRSNARLINRHNDHSYIYKKAKEFLGIHSKDDE